MTLTFDEMLMAGKPFDELVTAGYALRIEPAGHRDPLLLFTVGPWRCGQINDGVGLEHAGGENIGGGWVVSYADLKAMYELATKVRQMAIVDTEREGNSERIE